MIECRLRRKIFGKVCDGVALDLNTEGTPRRTGGSGGVNAGGVIHKVGSKGGILNLAVLQIPGQLVNDGTDHFQMPQFFRT